MTPEQIKHIRGADVIWAGGNLIWGTQLLQQTVDSDKPTSAHVLMMDELTDEEIEQVRQIKAPATDGQHRHGSMEK